MADGITLPARRGRRDRTDSGATSRSGRPQLRLVRSEIHARRDAAARASQTMLLGATTFLTSFGLVMVLSAGSVSAAQGYDGNSFWYFERQVLYAAVGVCALMALRWLPYVAWKRLCLPLLAVSAILMAIALHPSSGTALYGASRWIDLGPITLQPSELAKLGLITFSATVLARKGNRLHEPLHLLIPVAPAVGLIALLGLLQKDLGTTGIICGTVFLMLFAAGVRLRYLALTGILGVAGTTYLILGESYRRARFLGAWLHPETSPLKDGYQLIQSLVALGSGGWTGVGLGQSRAKWDFLPNAHSDFIFAVIGEELGLIGALLVLAGFGLLLFAGIRIAVNAPDTFGRLLAAGITSWIGLQTLVNLGAVTGLLPITGVPLPLVSFGGTALVITLASIGVLASISRASAGSGEGRPVGRASPPEVPS